MCRGIFFFCEFPDEKKPSPNLMYSGKANFDENFPF